MKLLLITDGISPFTTGGMQKHSANLAKWLTKKGVQITLMHSVPFGEPIPTDKDINDSLFGESSEELDQIFTVQFPKPGKVPGHYIRNSKLLSKQYFEMVQNILTDFDFIYGKGFATWYFIEQKKKGIQMPPIGVKFHGYEMYQVPPSFKSRFEMQILRKPTKWNNVNADVVFNYGGKITSLIKQLGVSNDKIISIPTGIDDDWIRTEFSSTGDKKRFVFIGRFERRKGVQEIQYALENLIGDHANFQFDFIGPIPEEVQVRDTRVIYHGEIKTKEGITSILDQSDVLVCPSYSEGMPNVIMEGMARGLAVVATDVGAVAEQVSSKNGWLMPKADKELLFKIMQEVISESSSSIDSKKKASLQKLRDRFRWEVIAEDTKVKIQNYLDGRNN